uniref:Secreted protein n=1 Tax=Phakopsora pachyrhizi TaxID=170000 RepID=A0A0S1MK86_PHAPC
MPKSSLSSLILAFSLSSSFSLWHCNSHSLSVTLTSLSHCDSTPRGATCPPCHHRVLAL